MRITDANISGSTEEPLSDGEYTGSVAEQIGSSRSEGASETGVGGDELPTSSSGINWGSTSNDSGVEAPKKRGRKPGSKNADVAGSARRKLGDAFTGVVGFCLSAWGVRRASKYKLYSPILAQAVYNCYQIKEEEAAKVGVPLAESFIQWFPPKVVAATAKATDPAKAVGALFFIVQQCQQNEVLQVKTFQALQQQQGSQNGSSSPEEQWIKDHSPQPSEFHPD